MQVQTPEGLMEVIIPPGLRAGQAFQFRVHSANTTSASGSAPAKYEPEANRREEDELPAVGAAAGDSTGEGEPSIECLCGSPLRSYFRLFLHQK